MEKRTVVSFTSEARQKLIEGLNITANAVACTLGPRGRTVLIQQGDGSPILTKDGVTVSKSINLSDPLQMLGSKLVQEAAAVTNEVAGDGTTTATVITAEMVNKCAQFMVLDRSTLSIGNGLAAGVKHVLNNLRSMKIDVTSNEQIRHVATISANGSEKIGSLIAAAIERVTKDGIVTIEDARRSETSIDVVDGTRFERGYISPVFINDPEKGAAIYENCRVLVTNDKITDLNDVIELLNWALVNNEKLLIIADDVEGSAMQALILNRSRSANFQVVAVRSPGYGDIKNDLLNDICALAGTEIVGSTMSTRLKDTTASILGSCKKIIVTKSTTTLIGFDSNERLKERISLIKKRLEDITLSDEQRAIMRARVAALSGGVAIVRVGGATELEAREKKDRIEDALNATRAAIEEGIVPGGGVALLRAAAGVLNVTIPDNEIDADAFKSGLSIVKHACQAPLRRMIKNAGRSSDSLIEHLERNLDVGYDVRYERYVDSIQSGIIDPVKVTRCALENAASVAQTFLSMDAIVHEEIS